MSDWADEKAREYLRRCFWLDEEEPDANELAALLREVNAKAGPDVYSEARAEARRQTLAEVRRIVEEERSRRCTCGEDEPLDGCSLAEDILERLEKL